MEINLSYKRELKRLLQSNHDKSVNWSDAECNICFLFVFKFSLHRVTFPWLLKLKSNEEEDSEFNYYSLSLVVQMLGC